MAETANNLGEGVPVAALPSELPDALEGRIFRSMLLTAGAATILSAIFYSWRVAAGIFLGGVLSLLNHHWLRQSISAALNVDVAIQRPRMKAAGYIFRYLFLFGVVALAYQLQLVSLPATIVGLCSFVVAFIVEAFRQTFFALIHREESN